MSALDIEYKAPVTTAGLVPNNLSDITVFRKDLENQVYAALKNDPGNPDLLKELDGLLLNHAQAVMYAILRRNDPVVIREAVDEVLMDLPSFSGASSFTTWAHRILLRNMYDQRRLERKRKEISVDIPGFDLAGEESTSVKDLLLTVHKALTAEEYALFEQIALLGKTQREVAVDMECSQPVVHDRWLFVVRKLKDAFGK